MSTGIRITAPWRSIKGDVILPESKSMMNRILMLKAYNGELLHEKNENDAGDTALLKRHLATIAASNTREEITLNCENAGTVLRFLLSFLAQREGEWVLSGSGRMLERPIEPLVSALQVLDADIEYLEKQGFPPLRIKGRRLSSAAVTVDTSVSSQFISSLLMLAPVLENGLTLQRTGENVSVSYTDMTIKLLRRASVNVMKVDDTITVHHGILNTKELSAEKDWSSAAFWYTLVALSQRGKLLIRGLGDPEDSIQGDAVVSDIFRSIGVSTNVTDEGIVIQKHFHVPALTRIRLNMKSTPDLVLPVVTALSGLGYGALITGIEHIQYKESDRIRALITELRALNGYLDYSDNMLVIHPSDIRVLRPVNTYNDHRMAMAFAPLAMVFRTIEIRDPLVVNKSYPQFWDMFEKLGFEMIMR